MYQTSEFEDYLLMRINENDDSYTKKAMSYSLMNGGKRVRPALLFAALEGYGINPRIGYPCACAIEMIHTYSLIHDDLPAMDDDDLRRGKPSCHKAFNEATAILAGDGLLTKAFEVVLDSECSDHQKIELVRALSTYSGIDGMIYGQTLDIASVDNQNPTLALLLEIDQYKTAKLITLPLVCACILANKKEDLKSYTEIGYALGLEFQMQDDILDVTQSEEVLGKSTSDLENNKVTAVSLLGLEKARQMVKSYDETIQKELSMLSCNTDKLSELVDNLLKRTY